VYVVLRLWTLLLSAEAGWSALFGGSVLVWGGLATIVFAAIGLTVSQQLRRLASFGVVLSAGTLLAVIGFADAPLIGGGLYYLVGSAIGTCMLFLVADLVERVRESEAARIPYERVNVDHLPFDLESAEPLLGDTDEEEGVLAGRVIPATLAFVGIAFTVCALIVAGMPPLSGFLAKVAMLSALLPPPAHGGGASLSAAGWTLLVVLIGSGFLATIGLARAGIRYFWAPSWRELPRLRVLEALPIAALMLVGGGLAVFAGPVLQYAQATAEGLLEPARYVDAVLQAIPVAGPVRSGAPAPGLP
jgi:multicomponent K+:H+ antiporter subunit D